MGIFGNRTDDEPDIYDPDETDELLLDSELYFEAPPLKSTSVTITPKDIRRLDTDGWLECIEELPYDFRCYLDVRRAFSRALKSCRDEISDFESYDGGKSADYAESFDFDGHSISIDFTLSKADDRAPFVFTADIKVEE